jgi:hypothetical protein
MRNHTSPDPVLLSFQRTPLRARHLVAAIGACYSREIRMAPGPTRARVRRLRLRLLQTARRISITVPDFLMNTNKLRELGKGPWKSKRRAIALRP